MPKSKSPRDGYAIHVVGTKKPVAHTEDMPDLLLAAIEVEECLRTLPRSLLHPDILNCVTYLQAVIAQAGGELNL